MKCGTTYGAQLELNTFIIYQCWAPMEPSVNYGS